MKSEKLKKQILHLEKINALYKDKLNFSQFGEQLVINNILSRMFKNNIKFNKFYLDIGAYDPVLFSNTFNLYRLGWRGICVEPNETKMKNWHQIRPADVVLTKAVVPDNYSDENIEMMSANSNSAIEMVNSSLIKRKVFSRNTMKFRYLAKCIKFKDLMDQCKNLNLEPSFLNMDIEGLEESISIHSDLAKYRIPLLCIEHVISEFSDKLSLFEYQYSKLVNYFLENKYYLVNVCGLSLIFCHKDFYFPFE